MTEKTDSSESNPTSCEANSLAEAAFQWFADRRPHGWTLERHLEDPEYGCTLLFDRRLAQAVAADIKSRLRR